MTSASTVLITVAELRHRLSSMESESAGSASDDPLLILDVRWALGDPDGYRHYLRGHVPGARFVDLDQELAGAPGPDVGRHPLPSIDDLQAAARSWGLRNGQDVVVYDDTGALAAARAWWLLRWAGVSRVRILDGGLGAWTAGGGTVEPGPPAPVAGDVTLSAGHLPVLDADSAARLARASILLDARAGARYRAETEPVDARAGHIPGAISAPTTDNLADDRTFRSSAELRERFAALGARVDDGQERAVGVYCGSGVTAAHQVAALAIVGIPAALYPGSWSQWSADPNRAVATGEQPG